MPITLPPLPYSLDALAPTISANTMEVHYGKHHKGYVDKANKLIEGTELQDASLEEIIRKSNGPLANSAAQAWNHEFFWKCLSPSKTKPSAAVTAAVDSSFGSMDELEKKIKAAAGDLFGSGWAWLVRGSTGNLDIVSTPNAALLVHEQQLFPLLTIDVWEHAYYLDYKNERPRFINGVWDIINWDFVDQRLTEAATRGH